MEPMKVKMYEKEFRKAQAKALKFCDEAEQHQGKDDYLCESAIRVANYWIGVSSGIMTAFNVERKYDLLQCEDRIKSIKKEIKALKKNPGDPVRLSNFESLLRLFKAMRKKIKAEIEEGEF